MRCRTSRGRRESTSIGLGEFLLSCARATNWPGRAGRAIPKTRRRPRRKIVSSCAFYKNSYLVSNKVNAENEINPNIETANRRKLPYIMGIDEFVLLHWGMRIQYRLASGGKN